MRARSVGRPVLGLLAVALAAAPLAAGVLSAAPAGASPNGFLLLFTTGTSTPSCTLAGIDLATGTVTPTSHNGSDACASDLAETADGRVFGILQHGTLGGGTPPTVHLVQYNTTTGVPTDVGQIGSFNAAAPFPDVALRGNGQGFGGVTFDRNGSLFVEMLGLSGAGGDPNCNQQSVCLYRVDPTNLASATFIGAGPLAKDLEFFTAACDGRAMTLQGPPIGVRSGSAPSSQQSSSQSPPPGGGLGAQDIAVNQQLLARDLGTGVVTAIGSGVGATNVVDGLAFDSTGTLWGVGGIFGSTFNVFTINTTTGVATPGPTLSGNQPIDPIALALPLNCPTPAAPTTLVVTPRFTG